MNSDRRIVVRLAVSVECLLVSVSRVEAIRRDVSWLEKQVVVVVRMVLVNLKALERQPSIFSAVGGKGVVLFRFIHHSAIGPSLFHQPARKGTTASITQTHV